MRRARSATNSSSRAFTLVELITVMAILAVLMAMIVGAARGIQEGVRHQATLDLFEGLKGALRNYADAYAGKYPWKADVGPMRNVTSSTKLLGTDISGGERGILFPSGQYPSNSWEYYEEAYLYAALMSPVRGGPFARGLAGRTVARKDGTKQFALFADGWNRPITYHYDEAKKELTLRSLGANAEDDDDDIICYVLQPSDS